MSDGETLPYDHTVYNHAGDACSLNAVVSHHFGDDLSRVLVGTDMDGTMLTGDLGRLVFLEKLGEPTFWNWDIDYFAKLLLPKDYQAIVKKIVVDLRHPLRNAATFIWVMWPHITKLYGKIKQAKAEGHDGMDIRHPLMNEFARCMMEFDKAIITMEKVLSSELGGELLMRTRFFAGKNTRDIRALTRRVMQRKSGNGEVEAIELKLHDENRDPDDRYDLFVNLALLKPEHETRIVQEVEGVRLLLNRLLVDPNGAATVRVLTTNLTDIASEAIRSSRYSRVLRPTWVTGNHLKRQQGQHPTALDAALDARMRGKHVYGPRKVEALRAIEHARNLITRVAIGDSHTNDGPMMEHALKNEGLAFIVTGDLEAGQKKFRGLVEQGVDVVGSEPEKRTFYILQPGAHAY